MKRILERTTVAVMAAGILMVWQPWAHSLFRWGFLVTIAGIVGFMIASHLPQRQRPAAGPAGPEARP
ncbi:MAG TPA: hypothetical protein VIL86_14055 [Tepidisphaeraceae bacterium]|jgi:hypothetical protein